MDRILNNKKLQALIFAAMLILIYATFLAPSENDHQVINVNPQQAQELIAGEPDLIILDVREPHEFQEGHIPGAIIIPLGVLKDNLNALDSSSPILLVCRSGNRSMQAAGILLDEGYKELYNLSGGMLDWPYNTQTD